MEVCVRGGGGGGGNQSGRSRELRRASVLGYWSEPKQPADRDKHSGRQHETQLVNATPIYPDDSYEWSFSTALVPLLNNQITLEKEKGR